MSNTFERAVVIYEMLLTKKNEENKVTIANPEIARLCKIQENQIRAAVQVLIALGCLLKHRNGNKHIGSIYEFTETKPTPEDYNKYVERSYRYKTGGLVTPYTRVMSNQEDMLQQIRFLTNRVARLEEKLGDGNANS